MPQPIRRACDVRLIGLFNLPEHAAWLGRIVAVSGALEALLGHYLALLTGVSSRVTMSMFHAVTSTDAQRAMLTAAAEEILCGAELEEFRELMSEFKTRYSERSRLVHNVWGESAQLPNKAIWIAAKDATRLTAAMASTTDSDQLNLLMNHESGQIWKKCSTYTAKEMQDAHDRLSAYTDRVRLVVLKLHQDHPVLGAALRQAEQASDPRAISPPEGTPPDQNPA